VQHCTSGTLGVTPSDFPLAGLTQARLDALALDPAQVQDLYPLSPMQAGMLFHCVYAPEGSAYTNQLRVDVDGLDPAFAPGTGTPVPGGLSTAQALSIVRGLTGIDMVGADVVEVAPAYDHADITALAAAHVASELICLFRHRARSDKKA